MTEDDPSTADYLIMGAGAVGMAFADSLLTHSTASMVIVDRHHRPGGHWNDAYPFVRLHQPASFYGVSSRELGSGVTDEVGLNKGFHELASGQEVLSHFDLVMQQRFLASGRVRYFPMSEVGEDGSITSLLTGERRVVRPDKFVDATHSKMQVPSTHTPSYAIGAGITCVPLNQLPWVAPAHDTFVVIGAGKTGMDACIWLLQNGANPDAIRWIMPRDSWLVNRAGFQPGAEHFARTTKGVADQVEAIAEAKTTDEVFARMEACGEYRRIDPTVRPEAYHCAVVSDGELAQLRRVRDIVRLGRVTRLDADRIALERGTIPADPGALYIDCSAAGIPNLPSKPVFDGDRITLQWVRVCQPTFSAALIGFVESTMSDELVKNQICNPIEPPTVPLDFLRMMKVELANRQCWDEFSEIGDWRASSRLDGGVAAQLRSLTGTETEVMANLGRYVKNVKAARLNLESLLADSDS